MTDHAATNTLWGGLTAEMLARLGVEDVVVSPGSRSTPLTVGVARHPRLQSRVILDERSAGFFALGLARARAQPVALVCTSGSAVANYYPALVEASESGVPLLFLTADRPPELRHRQAGQTIDQTKIFGGFVRWYAEAPVPEETPEVLMAWRDLLVQAVARAVEGDPGPVHLNCPFREPLGPVDPGMLHLSEALAPLVEPLPARLPAAEGRMKLPSLPARGWIVAGPARPADEEAYVLAVGRLAESLDWPILADALNPCRHFTDCLPVPVLTAYDTFLRAGELARRWRPDGVLQLGPLPTSKVLRRHLARWQLPTWIASRQPRFGNAAAAPAVFLGAGPEGLEVPPRRAPGSSRWWSEMASLDTRARLLLERALDEAEHTEPAIAACFFEALPAETPVFVASSMPVRDAEYFWSPNDERRQVHFNRGANGIDGTLSTALGMAEGCGRPAVLYAGDLALLHDTNGLLVASNSFSGSLTIVCVNNGGGGIFQHLPIARQEDLFEDFFATPQSVDFRSLAHAYGVGYQLVNNASELGDRMRELPDHGVHLLEVRTDREADALFRKGLFERVATQL